MTYRFFGHFFGDQMAYIPPEELEAAKAADPVPRFADRLVEDGVIGQRTSRRDRGRADSNRSRSALVEVLASPATDVG